MRKRRLLMITFFHELYLENSVDGGVRCWSSQDIKEKDGSLSPLLFIFFLLHKGLFVLGSFLFFSGPLCTCFHRFLTGSLFAHLVLLFSNI